MELALTSDSMLAASAVIVVVLILAGVAAALLVKKLLVKLVCIIIAVALAVIVWGQRQELSKCADHVVADITTHVTNGPATCTFFGYDLNVPMPAPKL
jgi:hypothetical protein